MINSIISNCKKSLQLKFYEYEYAQRNNTRINLTNKLQRYWSHCRPPNEERNENDEIENVHGKRDSIRCLLLGAAFDISVATYKTLNV